MKTTKAQLEKLAAESKKAEQVILDFKAYQKAYNKQHGIKKACLIEEIISLHKQGLSNAAIIAKGYNKHTVKRRVGLFKKGTRKIKTTVSKFLPALPKKTK